VKAEDLEAMKEYLETFDADRQEEWLLNTPKLDEVEYLSISYVGLAALDARLVQVDRTLLKNGVIDSIPLIHSKKLSEHYALSGLWVLGAYELCRTLHEYTKDEKNKGSRYEPYVASIKSLKGQLAEVRIPMAKLQKPKKGRKNAPEASVAWPAFSPSKGIAWEIGDGIAVARQTLSDQFLSLMKSLS
jgi:hypothetical protein